MIGNYMEKGTVVYQGVNSMSDLQNASIPSILKEYMDVRIKDRLDWYDRHSVINKRLYMTIQYVSLGASILTVVLLDIDSIPRIVPTILAALVALLVSVEKVGQFGNHWQLYRLSAESLESEKQLFLNGAGPYNSTTNDNYKLFVERTEHFLSSEANRWHASFEEAHTMTKHTRHFTKE